MRLADKISLALIRWVPGSADIVLPNFYYGRYEMDVFRLLPSGFIYEYEIKISRADFKNDFKKFHSTGWKESRKDIKKHDNLSCNRFFFVVPVDLVKESEIPANCGLIYYNEGHLMLIKNAPLIHKNKVKDNFYAGLARKLSFREQNLRFKIRRHEQNSVHRK